jgi:hypothetical protein
MKHIVCILCAVGYVLVSPAAAQITPPPPELENRIPAPLPPPPEPPIINGPLQQGPAPGVAKQRRLRTPSDRATGCLQEGAGYGLRGGELDAYTRSCVNAQ